MNRDIGNALVKKSQKINRQKKAQLKEIKDLRTPEERREDEIVIERLARDVFSRISIEETALRKAVWRWFIHSRQNEAYAMDELKEFFQGQHSETAFNAAKESGKDGGFDAMNLIITNIREFQKK